MEKLSLTEAGQTHAVISEGKALVFKRYGDHRNPGEHHLEYHNLDHTNDVINAVTTLGMLALSGGKISPVDLSLLRIAASFHDAQQLMGPGRNEDESAELAADRMRLIGFDEGKIRRVKSLIKSTKYTMENGQIVQKVTEDDYPSMLICDADLSLLGSQFTYLWQRSYDLFKEQQRKKNSPLEIPKTNAFGSRSDAFRGFTKQQLRLVRGHEFLTSEAKRFYFHQPENIMQIQKKLEEL